MPTNPRLAALRPFIGQWSTVGRHPLVPGTVFHGKASFGWIEQGAFLQMRTSMQEPEIPDAIAIVGSDDDADILMMNYFDVRGVSRLYESSVDSNVWKWWRNAPSFSQRFIVTLAADGRTMHGAGEMSRAGAAWEPDLELTYTRDA